MRSEVCTEPSGYTSTHQSLHGTALTLLGMRRNFVEDKKNIAGFMLKQALLLNLIFQTFFKAILESNATFCMLFPNNCQTIKYALHSLYYSNCFRQ